MSSEPVKVVITPEKMAELKQKYPDLNEETLQEVLESVHVAPVQGEESRRAPVSTTSITEEPDMMPQLFRKMQGGDFTMVDYLMWSDMQDRREERRRRLDRENQGTQVTPQTVAEAVVKGMKEALGDVLAGAKATREEEVPGWAKNLQSDVQGIKKQQEKDEEEKRLKDRIKEVTEPIKGELDKEREERKRLEDKMKQNESRKPEKTAFDEYVDTHKKLKEAGLIKEGGELPPGTPGEVTVATKTLDKGEKVLTKGMDDVKDTLTEWMEFQLEREKRQFQQTAPKLPEIKEEEKLQVLQNAAGEEGGA